MPRRMCDTSAVRPAPPGRCIGSPSRPPTGMSGNGSAAVWRMHSATGATFSIDLTGDQRVAGLHRVEQSDLDRVEAARCGQLVHLSLVGEACLHDTEPAHRPARQVVGAHRIAVDGGVETLVRPLRVGDGVDQHGRRRRCVGTAVEHHACFDPLDHAGAAGVVPHPDGCRMAMDVAEEALLAAVRDAHWPTGAQRQQAGVHLQADVFASTERAADPAERQSNLLGSQVETRGDLGAVFVQPLRRDEQLDAGTAGIGHAPTRPPDRGTPGPACRSRTYPRQRPRRPATDHRRTIR